MLFALFAAWRILVITQSGRWATDDPQRALRWDPAHAQALLALAEQQLAAGKLDEARGSARRLLASEPLEGRAFRILAAAEAQQGHPDRALTLYEIAARRSPRDLRARAWLTEHYLVAGNYPAALRHIDILLRTSPGQGSTLMPVLGQLAVDPDFAAELARVLERRPPWRVALLTTLQRAKDPRGADHVLAALRAAGGLDEVEFDEWIAYLIRQGRWGEAYGRWAGTLELQGGALPLVYNGSFEQPVSNRGFDWRLTRVPGVSVDFVPDRNARGLTAHAAFRGRPAAGIGLEQPMLLAPGRYRFSARMRGDALRSERGLEWNIVCMGAREPAAISESIEGTFGWRALVMEVNIPFTACPGQWLRLRNPAPPGSIQQVSGEVWLDEVAIQPQR
ncbi:tetratricopeptide repeat protein [Pseudoxanthomonas gei]|uniref:tetratricopeptide repeat protein n=1 Tax=Pseudoxanthomonas gei TaxID=1383030 RepID=UPI001390AA93|nr:tetratricopeptide repeat protein [Pseudoxanthomonas gei]